MASGFFVFRVMRKIEHLGIAVSNMDESIQLFQSLLGSSCYKIEEVFSEHVKTAFFHVGESKIELVAATDPNSPIAKYLEKKGAGIHHIAFDVENIEVEIDRLLKEGFELISATPKDGADNKRIAFLHPKSTNGVLVELCEEKLI